MAKLLGATVPLVLLLFSRFAIQTLLLWPLVLTGRLRFWTGGRMFALLFLRSALHIVGIGAMFASLRYLPLADAVAIAFVMPFIMLLLGKLVLGEEVGPHRLSACAVGFCGTLLVIQPNFVEVGAPALLPLVVAVVFALFMLVTRMLAKTVDPIALQAVSVAQASLLLLPAVLFWPGEPLGQSYDTTTLMLIGTMGILGTGAHLLMTWSLRFAPSATLAPMQYLEIPVSTLIGWLIFRDLPNGLAAIGIAVTIAAGLYIISRERTIARKLRGPTAP
jgi:drug/metabolite transporter (DMT)-like permease